MNMKRKKIELNGVKYNPSDLETLEFLNNNTNFKKSSKELISTHFNVNIPNANRRLKRLRDAGLIYIDPQKTYYQQAMQHVYSLSTRGKRVLALYKSL
jgi:DNA-binding transcriptional ArsR family regulator